MHLGLLSSRCWSAELNAPPEAPHERFGALTEAEASLSVSLACRLLTDAVGRAGCDSARLSGVAISA
jgi:hypothetical protein